jgi:hypothetical protein
MGDGGLIVELDETLSRRLEAAAASAGRSPVDYALSLIAEGLDEDWAEDDARFAEYERTGESVDAEEALLRMRASLVERFSTKA